MSLLSEKIANTRLTMDAQNKVHSLDEFRSTVNYVNTTNKGYVRFAASLVDMRKKIEGTKVLKLFAPRSKR